jgi:hypothetical protein
MSSNGGLDGGFRKAVGTLLVLTLARTFIKVGLWSLLQGDPAAAQLLESKALRLITLLRTGRSYVTDGAGGYTLDTRFLVFEYNHNITLTPRQCSLVSEIYGTVAERRSSCVHQMIMVRPVDKPRRP